MLGDDVAKDDELFGLQWKGKAQARRAATTPSLGTLRPCKEESVDWDTTKNLYLKGTIWKCSNFSVSHMRKGQNDLY